MNRIDATAIALRIFALWLGFKGLEAIVTTLGIIQWAHDDPQPASALVFLLPGLVVVLALAIWFSPYSLARVFLPRPTSESIGTWSREDAQLVAFATVGVYLVGQSLSSISYWVFFLHRSHAMKPGAFEATPSMIASVAGGVAQLVVGLLLVFGGRGLVRALRLARAMDK